MSILGVNRKSDILSLAEQLKGKLPFPFETIAVAVNFSAHFWAHKLIEHLDWVE